MLNQGKKTLPLSNFHTQIAPLSWLLSGLVCLKKSCPLVFPNLVKGINSLFNQLCAGSFLDMSFLMEFTIIASIHASKIPRMMTFTSTFHGGIKLVSMKIQIKVMHTYLVIQSTRCWSASYCFGYLVSFHFLTSEWCCISTILLCNYALYLSVDILVVDIYSPAKLHSLHSNLLEICCLLLGLKMLPQQLAYCIRTFLIMNS